MAVDMFLKLEGIDGESIDFDHADEIDLLDWSWGMDQSGTTHVGTGGGAGKVNVQDVTFTHYVDKASANVMKYICAGEHVPEAILTCRKAGGTPLEYFVLTMTNCIISAISISGSKDSERVVENITLNFQEFEAKYQAQNAEGAAEGGEILAAYNMAENAEV